MSTQGQTATIVHHGTNKQTLHLPLEEISVSAIVVDGKYNNVIVIRVGALTRTFHALRLTQFPCAVSAKIIISHIFSNPSPDSTGRAKYIFPVPARAAVCGFGMKTSDGRELIGMAKENQRAEEEYRHAVEQSKVAGLVQWGADDGVYPSSGVFT